MLLQPTDVLFLTWFVKDLVTNIDFYITWLLASVTSRCGCCNEKLKYRTEVS